MANKKETAAPNVSVGADTEQPPNVNNNSITNYPPKNNSKALETVSMAELYDSVYPSKPPLIDGLLYPGTYLFVGAPKLGKSFLMAQIAYHISRCFTLPLKMITAACRKGCTVCLERTGQTVYSFLSRRVILATDWINSCRNL